MRLMLIFALPLVLALAALPATAKSCTGQGISCLFVDGAGCAITCDNNCWATSAYCSFGFGSDAICRCHDDKCDSRCQSGISTAVGQYGLRVTQILTDCEVRTVTDGGLGGGCYFMDTVQAAFAAARTQAMSLVTEACEPAAVETCYGVPTEELLSRLLKNAESAAAGACRNIWEDMPVEEPLQPLFVN
jgi:hypothetical protein